MTQREANILCEGTTMDNANYISNFMNMIMTCCFFSPLVPLAIPMAMISSFICYWTAKYNLLRKVKMPEMYGPMMGTFFINMMPYLIIGWATVSYLFFYGLSEAINNPT